MIESNGRLLCYLIAYKNIYNDVSINSHPIPFDPRFVDNFMVTGITNLRYDSNKIGVRGYNMFYNMYNIDIFRNSASFIFIDEKLMDDIISRIRDIKLGEVLYG